MTIRNGSHLNETILDGLESEDDERRWAQVLRECQDIRLLLQETRQKVDNFVIPGTPSVPRFSYDLQDMSTQYPQDNQYLQWAAESNAWVPTTNTTFSGAWTGGYSLASGVGSASNSAIIDADDGCILFWSLKNGHQYCYGQIWMVIDSSSTAHWTTDYRKYEWDLANRRYDVKTVSNGNSSTTGLTASFSTIENWSSGLLKAELKLDGDTLTHQVSSTGADNVYSTLITGYNT